MDPHSDKPRSNEALRLWIVLGGVGLLTVCGSGLWYAVTFTRPDSVEEDGAPTEPMVEGLVNELAEPISVSSRSLKQVRQNHKTRLRRFAPSPQQPPDDLESSRPGQWLNFESDGRLLFGCLRLPKGTGPHPAVVYCHGGFALGDGDIQDIEPLVEKGFAVFVPAWRAENGNAGSFEMYYGEVADAVAAMEFVARLPHVDENAVFLAGHSAGATIALLAAELSDRPRAVMACGPVLDMTRLVQRVGAQLFEEAPFAIRETRETDSRSPGRFLNDLSCPAQLVYGDGEALLIAQAESVNKQVQKGLNVKTVVMADRDHFSVLPEAIASAATFFSAQMTTKRQTSAVEKPDIYGPCRDRIPGPQPVPLPTHTAQIASRIERWDSEPDPGEPLNDWSGFARWYNKDAYKVPRKPAFRVYPDNGRWMTSESFENDFVIAALDGSELHTLTGTVPNLLNGASDSRYRPAGVSPDGKQFAIVWTGQVASGDPVRSWLTIHQSSDGKVLHSAENIHGCQLLTDGRAMLFREHSADRKKNAGRSVNVISLKTGAVSDEIRLGPDDRIDSTPGGNHAVVLRSVGDDARLEVYSIDSGQLMSSGTYDNVPVGLNVALSHDGKEAFTVGQRRATVWNLESGEIVFSHRVSDVHQVAGWLDDRRFLLLDQYKVLDRSTGNRVATLAHRVMSPNDYAQHGPWLAAREIRPGQQPPRRIPVESLGKLCDSMPAQPTLNRSLNISISLRCIERGLSEMLFHRGEPHLVRQRDGLLTGNPRIRNLVRFGICRRIGATFEEDAEVQSAVLLKHTSTWSAASESGPLQLHGTPLSASMPRAGIMNKPRATLTLQMEGTLAPPPSAPRLARTTVAGSGTFVAEHLESVTAESEFDESQPFDVGLPWLEQVHATALTKALSELKFPPADEFRLAPANDTWRQMLVAAPDTVAVEPKVTTARFSLDSPFLLEGSKAASYVLHETLRDDESQVGGLAFVHSGEEVVVLAGLKGPRIREYKLTGESRDVAKMTAYNQVAGFQRDDSGSRWIAQAGGDKLLIGDDTPGSMAVIVFSHSVDLRRPVLTADGKFIVVPTGARDATNQLAVWKLAPLLKSRRGEMIELPDAEALHGGPRASTYLPIPGSSDLMAIEYQAVHRIRVADGSVVWRSEFKDKAKSALSGEILGDGSSALILCRSAGEFPGILVDLKSGSLTDQPPSKRQQELRVYSPDQTMFAAPFEKDHVAIYHARTEEQIWTAQVGSLNGIPGQINSMNCVVWSPDGRYLAAACNDSQRGTKLSAIDVWDVSEINAR